jgi:hypothetical protein
MYSLWKNILLIKKTREIMEKINFNILKFIVVKHICKIY